MRKYVEPELEIILFDYGDIHCDTILNDSRINDEEEFDWFRPEEEDE